jgi:hypothetical protein
MVKTLLNKVYSRFHSLRTQSAKSHSTFDRTILRTMEQVIAQHYLSSASRIA